MKKAVFTFSFFVCFFVCFLATNLSAQQASDRDNSSVILPWEEFKKYLNLDENQIVIRLEIFEKLVAQTGMTTTPPHTITNGNVVLSRSDFENLVNQMKRPDTPETKPPFPYLVTKAVYSGTMNKSNTNFDVLYEVHVLEKNAYIKIPLLPQHIAIRDVKIGNRQALIVSEGGYHTVLVQETGTLNITASFSMRSAIDKGPQKLDLAIQRTPITLFELELPFTDIDVEIPQAQQIATTQSGKSTRVSAMISPGNSISVQWRKKLAVTEKIPAKLYGEMNHLLSIGDDALNINSDVILNILHSEIDGIRFIIPEDVNVLSVSGEGVGEWQETEQQGQRVLLVPFTYGKKGYVSINVISEKTLAEEGMVSSFAGLQLLDAVRENGFIGIELNTSAEVIVAEQTNVEKVPVQKLPANLYNKSAKPLILGFKYLKHPNNIVLQIERHKKIAVPTATIHSANVVTLFTEDGKVVHRLVYQVRNNAKQFLELQLPENADVWSVFVANSPVESSLNSKGKLLIPLIRSQREDNNLATFSVEVIYCLDQDRFTHFGKKSSNLPAADLITSQIMWSIYLPNDYAYWYFHSTLEKEEIIRGITLWNTQQRTYDETVANELMQKKEMPSAQRSDELRRVYKGKDYKSQFRNVPMEEEQLESQVDAELGFSGRLGDLAEQDMSQAIVSGSGVSSGVLPIHIKVPTSGQVYRFAKIIVKPDDPLEITVQYTRFWVIKTLRWTAIIILLVILCLLRKIVKRWIALLFSLIQKGWTWYKPHHGKIVRICQSKVTLFVLFFLFLLSWMIRSPLFIIFSLLTLASIIYHITKVLESRSKKKHEALNFEPEDKQIKNE